MDVIERFPMRFDVEEMLRTFRVRTLTQNSLSMIVEVCRPLIEPKAVYVFDKVSRIQNEHVHLESGHVLKSLVLADSLENEQALALYVITVGSELEKKASEMSKSSMLQGWIMESIGDYALRKAFSFFESMIEKTLGSNLSSFGPGSGTGKLFGIGQQKVLFEILNPETKIGVTLTPSYLMVPRKSISGVIASTRENYVACQYCPREKCQNRRKPFSGDYVRVRCGQETG